MLTPTIGRPVTLAELTEEPVLRNSELGYYTNFMNLLDYAAVAVPTGFMANGLPWGVTLFGRAFTDQYLLSVASALHGGEQAPSTAARNDKAQLVVCGAHLDGLALNWQLKRRGARLLETTHSSADYRLYALAGGPPLRPGMLRVAEGGVAIEVEVWELPSSELGSFLTGIPAPLGLGKVQLADGRWESGFICEPYGLDGAEDISHLGGWRAWLASR
jgi:allophanate hydrolase